MDLQTVSNINIPEGEVRTIHDNNGKLLWGKLNYNVKYSGDLYQPTYTGKNLFDIDNNQTPNTRCSGVVSGESITVTSTQSSTGFYSILLPNSDNLLGKKFTISIGSTESNDVGKVMVYAAVQSNLVSVGGWYLNVTNIPPTGASKTGTFPSSYPSGKDCFVVIFYVGNKGGDTKVGDYTTYNNIQLELGEEKTSYEPYVGGAPSPSPSYPQYAQVVTGEQNIEITDGDSQSQDFQIDLGKNFIEIPNSKYTNAGIKWKRENNTFTGSGTPSGTYSFVIYNYELPSNIPAGSYTISIDAPLPSPYQYELSLYDIGNVRTNYQIPVGGTSLAVTFSKPIKKVHLALINMTAGSSVSVVIKNFRIVAPNSVVELYKINNYKDYIYKNNNSWFIHREIEKNSNYSGETITTSYLSTTGQLTSGATVYYAITTPVDTQITNTTLISQLDAIHEWMTRYGYNAIVTGNLPIIIDKTNL